jgi:hypothetical protein
MMAIKGSTKLCDANGPDRWKRLRARDLLAACSELRTALDALQLRFDLVQFGEEEFLAFDFPAVFETDEIGFARRAGHAGDLIDKISGSFLLRRRWLPTYREENGLRLRVRRSIRCERTWRP